MVSRRTAAHLLLDLLREAGVDRVFGVPGGPLLSVLDAMSARSGIEFVLAKHEEGAVFMAEGHAQATGRLGVALVTAGPGATHALTAAASATSDGVPVLVLSGQVAAAHFGRGALQDSSGGNWALDTVDMFRSATKAAMAVTDGDQLAFMVRRAIQTATNPLPGAVLVSVSGDVMSGPEPAASLGATHRAAPRPASPEEVRKLTASILAARSPVIFAGRGAKASVSNGDLVALAERGQIPVVTTMKGKGAFPESHPLSLGVFGNYGGSAATHDYVLGDDVDLLIVLGSSLGEVSTFGWDPRLRDGRTVIQVDLDPLQLGRGFPVDQALLADAGSVVTDLLKSLPSSSQSRSIGRPERLGALALQGEHQRLRASALAARLSETLPDDVSLFVDNGNALCWIGEHFVARPGTGIHVSLNVGCMGYAIPAAIGARMAQPTRPAVAVVGDAAFAMLGMEIHTAVEYQQSVIWIVLNNSGNGMVANLQDLLYESAPGSRYAHRLDAAAVARGLGASAAVATDLPTFEHALETALAEGGPWLIDARVDEDEVPWSLRGRAEALRGAA